MSKRSMEHYNELRHHGIMGQKWGVRRYRNPDGTLTALGKERYFDKQHFNETTKKSKEVYTKAEKTVSDLTEAYVYDNSDKIFKAVNCAFHDAGLNKVDDKTYEAISMAYFNKVKEIAETDHKAMLYVTAYKDAAEYVNKMSSNRATKLLSKEDIEAVNQFVRIYNEAGKITTVDTLNKVDPSRFIDDYINEHRASHDNLSEKAYTEDFLKYMQKTNTTLDQIDDDELPYLIVLEYQDETGKIAYRLKD